MEHAVELSEIQIRQGVSLGRRRYVLAISTLLAALAMIFSIAVA